MAKSMFKKCDNDEGYITVICLRDRYLPELEKLGFVDNSEKLSQIVEPSKPKKIPESKKFIEPEKITKKKGK